MKKIKNWSAQNKFLFILAIAMAIGSIVTITITALSPKTVTSDTNQSLCPPPTDKLSKSNSLKFHPIKVVTKPWRGEHNVYAIFALPLEY
ncbi:MAG: hypothetical protein DCF20_15050 [Pseudanabaena sp.]|nr:MAG: hypothetical protein DCF20_15050 [Pseudanabaena sp.]